MDKPQRMLTAVAVTLVVGGMCAYGTIQTNGPAYQQHPVVCIVTDFVGSSLSGLIFYLGSGWLVRRKERIMKQAPSSHSSGADIPIVTGDDRFYEEVARELQEKSMVPGLWTKAFAEMGGDDAKARALYIKYRVAQLAQASRQRLEKDRLEGERREEQQCATMEAAEQQARATFNQRFKYTLLAMGSGLLTLLFGIGGLCAFLLVPTGEDSGSSLAEAIAEAAFLLLIAFFCGLGTWRCYKETQ